MSGRIVGRVFERQVGSAPRKAVLLCLAEHSNPDGEMSFPSVARICQETELGESTVRGALSWLRHPDRQIILQTAGANQHRPATYAINLAALSALPLVEVYRQPSVPQASATGAPGVQVVAFRGPAPGPEPSLTPHEPSRAERGPHPPPPAVAIISSVTRRLPSKGIWPRIVQAVGSRPEALDKWRQVVEQWIAKGYKPTNIDAMLDVFAHGWRNGNGRKPAGPAPSYSAADDVAAFRARKGTAPRKEAQ